MKTRINAKKLRTAMAKNEIFTIADLARLIGCSRPAIYFAMERPSRYPRVYAKILEAIQPKEKVLSE